jgi:hypothetical protein
MRKLDLQNNRRGATGILIVAVIAIAIIVVIAAVAYAMTANLGDNDKPYVPPDEPDITILGYVSASVVVMLDNSELFGPLKLKFSAGSLTGDLQAQPTSGLNMFKGFDMWSHSKAGSVKFQLTNPGFSYDTGKMKTTFTGNVGGGSIANVGVDLPNGPAIKHHGTYQLSAWLYDDSGAVQDTITKSIDL